jgi:hypothetical protein
MLLCDFAETLGGKLYVMGGGWRWAVVSQGLNCTVAIHISIPWSATNQKHSLKLTLVGEDGEVAKDPNGEDVAAAGEFEVGRPPGVPVGTDLTNTLAIRFQGLPLEPGGYSFGLEINGTVVARVPFQALLAPPGGMLSQ